ncbi:hypothetical protein GCM10022247_11170 [Allokutzneria multivorans]|uniref:Uncharacterized protein n=1 Tax=Allokutzneria multivorans TaxID=1142134 RepID=A0ABP7R7G5_9PSEU
MKKTDMATAAVTVANLRANLLMGIFGVPPRCGRATRAQPGTVRFRRAAPVWGE